MSAHFFGTSLPLRVDVADHVVDVLLLTVTRNEEGAFEELARWCHKVLPGRIARSFPRLDPHLVAQSVNDGLLDYWANSPGFAAATLTQKVSYVKKVACGLLLNRRREECRRRKREMKAWLHANDFAENGENVGALGLRANLYYQEGAKEEESLEGWREMLAKVLAQLPLQEQAEVELLRQGIRKREVWAALLKIQDLNIKEQRRRIKRRKDYLLRKLRTLVRKWGLADR